MTEKTNREGYPLTRYCPFTRHACVSNCEWHDGDGCVIWMFAKSVRLLAMDIERLLGELKK